MTKAIIAPLRALAAGQVSAQTGSVDDFAKAEGGALAVEPLHTRVLFCVSHFGFTNYYGEFSGVSGALDFDPKNPSASKLESQYSASVRFRTRPAPSFRRLMPVSADTILQ